MLLSVAQAAKELNIAEVTVRKFIRNRKIAHRRIGGRILFTEQDIAEYVAAHRVEAVKPEVTPEAAV